MALPADKEIRGGVLAHLNSATDSCWSHGCTRIILSAQMNKHRPICSSRVIFKQPTFRYLRKSFEIKVEVMPFWILAPLHEILTSLHPAPKLVWIMTSFSNLIP
jgi:hypothetical protein